MSNGNPFSVEEFNKYWDSLTITEDFIFCKVFEEEELCKEMLEILLDIKIDHLEFPEAQKSLRTSHLAKGIRVDVFTKDDNRIFDVEIQNAPKEGIPFRTRYYHSTMDTSLLKKGKNYTDLKESYVIFLCKFDPIKMGKPVYRFSMRDEDEHEIILGDKIHTILYNICDYKRLKESERKNFFDYLMHGNPCSSFTKKTEKRFQEIKNDEDWRIDYMTLEMKFKEREREAVAHAVAQAVAVATTTARNEGIEQGTKQTAANFKKMGIPLEKIAEATGLSLKEIEALQSSL